MGMQRTPAVEKVVFTDSVFGVTRTGKPIDVSQYAFAGIHATGGLDAKSLNFIDNGEWGQEVVLSKALVEGFNPFTQDELLRLGPSMELSFETDEAVTGSIFLKLKS